jgi:ribosomal protein S18 acetylase RimI-like enzyme
VNGTLYRFYTENTATMTIDGLSLGSTSRRLPGVTEDWAKMTTDRRDMDTYATREVMLHTTYLELTAAEQLIPSYCAEPNFAVRQLTAVAPALYRFLFDTVGREYFWDDRLDWSDQAIAAHLARPDVTLLVAYLGDDPVGYAEIRLPSSEPGGDPVGYAEMRLPSPEPGAEITHLGLIAACQGRGFGKHLLTAAAQHAFAAGAPRVWLHTDNLDSPRAMHNYLARGFRPYRKTTHQDTIILR